MLNLALLQHVCESVNIEYPTTCTGLTLEQDQVFRMIDEVQTEICGMRDWWFLQRICGIRTWHGSSGTNTGATTGSPSTAVAITTDTPFHAIHTVNGKITLGTFGDDFATDVMRITASDVGAAAILSDTARGAVSGKPWIYGQDEYDLPADCDRVSFVVMFRDGVNSLKHTWLEPVSSEEMQNIRTNRAVYIDLTLGQPQYYCVLKTGTTSDHVRSIVFDPFPSVDAHMLIGYFTKPTPLYTTTTTVVPTIPAKYHQALIDGAIVRYYSSVGMGAPAGSPAGNDMGNRVVEAQKDYADCLSEMMGVTSNTGERMSFDAGSMSRIAYHEAFGRSI